MPSVCVSSVVQSAWFSSALGDTALLPCSLKFLGLRTGWPKLAVRQPLVMSLLKPFPTAEAALNSELALQVLTEQSVVTCALADEKSFKVPRAIKEEPYALSTHSLYVV